ncbi:hypothetical protein DL96DRAFT_1757336 [Flagelloscypha sp. PMI_526]|nr:hypothetical protein DL96DRAFT_1757336 [Flagelloscypha sp. PMI_526]
MPKPELRAAESHPASLGQAVLVVETHPVQTVDDSVAGVLSLPPEIIYTILCLVHSAFRYPSQSMLFQTIALTSSSRVPSSSFWTDASPLRFTPNRFLLLLNMSPHIATFVHTLHLEMNVASQEIQETLDIVKRLRGVPSLSLCSGCLSRPNKRSWAYIPSEMAEAITSMLLPEVQDLNLSMFSEVPFDFLFNLPRLRKLRLKDVNSLVDKDTAFVRLSTSPSGTAKVELSTVSITGRDSRIGHLLVGHNSFTQYFSHCTAKIFELSCIPPSKTIIGRFGDIITHLTYQYTVPRREKGNGYLLKMTDVPRLRRLTCRFREDFWQEVQLHDFMSHPFPSIFVLPQGQSRHHPLKAVHLSTIIPRAIAHSRASRVFKDLCKGVQSNLQNSNYVKLPGVNATIVSHAGKAAKYILKNKDI